jgi:hypothetical protein
MGITSMYFHRHILFSVSILPSLKPLQREYGIILAEESCKMLLGSREFGGVGDDSKMFHCLLIFPGSFDYL